jgi:hypothetical protein
MLTRILIVVAALICAIAGVASRAQAQLAPPTLPADEVYAPVVYVLSGPAQATDGDTVAFRLDYRPFTPPAGVPTGGGGAVFAYSIEPNAQATFEGIRTVAGQPATDLGAQGPGISERFALSGKSGTIEFLVRPVPGFSGPLSVGTYFSGIGIANPPGSVTSATTNIHAASPAAAAQTGTASVTATGTPAASDTPVTGRAPFLFPLRLVLTAPPEAQEGSVIPYRLAYDAVRPFGPGEDAGIVFVYGQNAKLVAAKAVSGAAPSQLSGVGEANIGFAGTSGVAELDVEPPAGFRGSFKVNIYVRGSGIAMPAGSQLFASTQIVSAPAATAPPSVTLPGTGVGTARQPDSTWALVVAFGVAGLTVLAGGVTTRRRR